jgi:hypothetical protein
VYSISRDWWFRQSKEKNGSSIPQARINVQTPTEREPMKLDGYIEHIDLGVDPQSGQKNILVRTETEFFKLTEEEQSRAWAPVKVASQILDRPAITFYQQTYAGKIPCKIIKKNAFDRHGLTLVNPYKSFTDGKSRKERDKDRIEKTVKRALKKTTWLSPAQRLLLVAIVNIKVGEFERENLKNKNKTKKGKGTGEGEHEQEVTA